MMTTLANSDFPILMIIVAISVGGLIAIVAIVTEARNKSLEIRQREETRREIAAYIAEGSMTPEEGERLLKAGNTRSVGQAISEAING